MCLRKKLTNSEFEGTKKTANAHDVVLKLPEKYNIFEGKFGGSISGRHSQRVFISYALIRSLRILIPDESTAALEGHITTSARGIGSCCDSGGRLSL